MWYQEARYRNLLVLFGICLLISSCVKEPEYPITPTIEFLDVQKKASSVYTQADSISIWIHFQDGDGDLGLSSSDSLPPFQLMNSDGTINSFYYNYFALVEKKNSFGEYEPISFADEAFSLSGRYPLLNTLNKETALEGDLKFSFLVFYGASLSPISKGDELRFRVKIADRALHLSNEVLTSGVVIGN